MSKACKYMIIFIARLEITNIITIIKYSVMISDIDNNF